MSNVTKRNLMQRSDNESDRIFFASPLVSAGYPTTPTNPYTYPSPPARRAAPYPDLEASRLTAAQLSMRQIDSARLGTNPTHK